MKPSYFLLVFSIYLIFSFEGFAQDGEYFVKISAIEETFETVSPIDGVQYVSYGRPAFSDDLGQYTFFQTVPEVAAITIDVEYGETLYYIPFPNISALLTPGDPVRVNDGRILATLFYVFSFDILYFDPTLEEDQGVNLSYFPTQTGNQYIGFTEYNPTTNKFYFHHSDETNLNESYITEIDVETGMISNEITSNRIIHAMFATTNSSELLVICNDEQSAGKQIGYLNTTTGNITPITTSLTFPWYYKASGSVDEENDWIYASSYTYEEGSKVNIIEFGTGDIEYNEYLILESEYSEDEWGFPAPDTSHNVINAYYSNIRNQLYGIHWGSGPTVLVDPYEAPSNWGLKTGATSGSYLLSGLQNELPKSLNIFDTNGRLIKSQDFSAGNEIDIRLPEAAGIYIAVVTENRKKQVLKLVRD